MSLKTENPQEKKINIDFSNTRKQSFLPSQWNEDRQDNTKNIKVIELQDDDDDTFLYIEPPTAHITKPLETFCTNSKYLGQWNRLGIAGKGVYRYPHGTIYDGYFNRNGEFHGSGILIYPSGQRIEGIWKNGRLQSDCSFITEGGVVMNTEYCKMPDRRFQLELEDDLRPAGQEYLTKDKRARQIPDGCYDVGEGIYDPYIKTVVRYPATARKSSTVSDALLPELDKIFEGDLKRQSFFAEIRSSLPKSNELLAQLLKTKKKYEAKTVLWIPNSAQEEWITKNCRAAKELPTKYNPDLYEHWTKGTSSLDDIPLEDVGSESEIETEIFDDTVTGTESDTKMTSFIIYCPDYTEEIKEKIADILESSTTLMASY
ncbi:uncharacterized protein LOC115884495 [Sitophilus oryzae]|uniref:Uncharacterized protein LOC115884495 n=1 Tax=Sitophilus oryzae TaxID=7048 RepID=A0A6J2Y570_SITOR|nr:uncharacterized protein LOC115884495 [Sitophilus oryzae]